jgi:cardiolipin synthase
MALYVKGTVAADLEAICCRLWNECSHSVKALPSSFPGCRDMMERGNTAAVRARINDWVKGKKEIRMSYADLIANARKDLVIACSYFLPGKNIRRLMRRAAARGVDVRILVAGPSDVPIAKQAERFLYRWMLRNNIRIYEYQKSVLHAKLGIADGRRMTIGSYNVNDISARASIELNLDVRNQPFVSAVKQQIDALIANDCIEITQTLHRKTTNWLKAVWQRICYETIAAILYLFTFYFRREGNY